MEKKDVRYIEMWPKRVPFPGDEYCSYVLDKLEDCYDDFRDRKCNVELSDDELIQIYIWSNNICHLLGIDFKNLRDDYFEEYRKEVLGLNGLFDAVDLIDSIVENKDKVLAFDREREKLLAINYYKVEAKCLAFQAFNNLGDFNYGCINYKNSLHGKNCINPPKFLYTKGDDELFPYYILGLKKYDKSKYSYFADTFISSYDPKAFFDGKEVTIPFKITINSKESNITRKEMIELLKEYQRIIDEYNIQNKMKFSKQKLLTL